MREIEFRAYCKSQERMLSFEHLKEATHGMVDTVNIKLEKLNIEVNKEVPYGLFLPLEDDDLILMQYTGLKDKNGTKIYEGDIVVYDDDYDFYGDERKLHGFIVKFTDDEVGSCGCCQTFFSGSGFVGERNVENFEGALHYRRCELGCKCEIIGNIYDNPELL